MAYKISDLPNLLNSQLDAEFAAEWQAGRLHLAYGSAIKSEIAGRHSGVQGYANYAFNLLGVAFFPNYDRYLATLGVQGGVGNARASAVQNVAAAAKVAGQAAGGAAATAVQVGAAAAGGAASGLMDGLAGGTPGGGASAGPSIILLLLLALLLVR